MRGAWIPVKFSLVLIAAQVVAAESRDVLAQIRHGAAPEVYGCHEESGEGARSRFSRIFPRRVEIEPAR